MRKDKPMPVSFNRYGYEYVRLPESNLGGAKTDMVIDPNIQFGAPTIKGTRLPLESLSEYGKNDGVERTAWTFKVSEDAVRDAIEYMNALPINRE